MLRRFWVSAMERYLSMRVVNSKQWMIGSKAYVGSVALGIAKCALGRAR